MPIPAFDRILNLLRVKKSYSLNEFRTLFDKFQQILLGNNRVLETMSEMEDKLGGEYIFDINYLNRAVSQLSQEVHRIVLNLNIIAENRYIKLFDLQEKIQLELEAVLQGKVVPGADRLIIPYQEINSDYIDLVGRKNSNLGEIKNKVLLPTPDGFALTAQAYKLFMDYNDLWDKITALNSRWASQVEVIPEQYDREIDRLYSLTKLPPALEKALVKGIRELYRRRKSKPLIAVRSSAVGEDEAGRSYAGQFATFLNCPSEEISRAYVKVLASRSKYTVRAYNGETDMEVKSDRLPMAAGFQEMIDSRAAGVIYTADPSGNQFSTIIITAARGLGIHIVSGTQNVDYYRVSKLDPSKIIQHSIGQMKGKGYAATPDEKSDLPPCLSEAQVAELAKMAIILDSYFKHPQDIEWCLDGEGRFYILQCRPLGMSKKFKIRPEELQGILAGKEVIMQGKGEVAQRGVAAGRVCHVHEDGNLAEFPVGAIAVTRHASPRLTSIIRLASAIITDVGSSTGHLATVAREFGVPTIIGTGTATQMLSSNLEITIDAEENIIYRGIIEELLKYKLEAEDTYRVLKEYKILKQILRRVTPLYLVDPNSSAFTAKNCRSYHDILRFCHEKAMRELADLNLNSKRFSKIKARPLKLNIPLGLSIVDIEGGISPESSDKVIESPEMIESVPMRSILKGLSSPGIWSTQPVQMGMGDIISSLTRYTMTERVPTYQGQNLAVIGRNYANLSLRLGYHFNVIDTYVSENIDANYIYFRFVGGVTENERRHRRALLLKKVLERLDFNVAVSGDLVIGRLRKVDMGELLRVLELLGRLIGFTRQLDTQMMSDEAVTYYANSFFELH